MEIDHIFIFTNDNGKIANELSSFGLTEGSSRVHQGQGTTNRTFSFDNFYFEIIWVHNEEEIVSKLVRPTGLWERANARVNNVSPFGLCIANTPETDRLFEKAMKYQPEYFPIGMAIDFLENECLSNFPWTFRLPFKGERRKEAKITYHKIGIKKLTEAKFGIKDLNKFNELLKMFEGEKHIQFTSSSDNDLTLTFDENKNGKTQMFEGLKLKINY